MPNLPNFAIPDVIDPPTTRCIQLQIPDDETWIQNFVGILAQPTYWFNWQRTGDNTGSQCAKVWNELFLGIDWSTMSCCCDNPPAIYRYNDEGVYQRSTDGGATWTDAPEYDYRNTSTVFPPPSALGIDTSRCQNADSAVFIINSEVVQALNDTFAAAQILALIAAVLLALLSAGSLAAFTPLITAIGAAILDVGVAATQAAFTTDVLDRLRCRFYCNMDTDTSINAAGLAAILSDTDAHETGIVQIIEHGIINAAGVVGITNMLRSNKGASDADCSTCCPDCATSWDIFGDDPTHFHGSIIERGIGYLIAENVGGLSGGASYILIRTPTNTDGCLVIGYEILSAYNALSAGGDYVPEVPTVGAPAHFPVGDITAGQCWNYLQFQSNSGGGPPFKIKLTFADC